MSPVNLLFKKHVTISVKCPVKQLALSPTIFLNLCFICEAALFVNVSATIDDGSTNSSVMRYAILYVSTNVFPEPGTDATLMLPSVCIIASVCSFVAFFQSDNPRNYAYSQINRPLNLMHLQLPLLLHHQVSRSGPVHRYC